MFVLELLARRRIALLLATVVAALLLTPLAANALAYGVLTVTYEGCSGLTVSPDPPATGNYLVFVNDSNDCPAAFSLTGPGVNLSSNLSASNNGTSGPFGPYLFLPGATYTARDSNIPATTTFSPSAADDSSSSSTNTSSDTSAAAGSSSSSAASSSTSAPSRNVLGTLEGSISATGKATLRIDGSTVNKLKAGLYELIVSDHSKKAGLIIQPVGYAASNVSGVSGTGTKRWFLRIIHGKYFFQATGGPKTYFSGY